MASMNTRLNIEKLDGIIIQKHGGSKQVELKQLGSKQVGFKKLSVKQVGFKQLGPSTGVHGVQVDKRVWFEVELQGAQGDHEAEVFQVSNDDAAVAQRRFEDKQLEEKTNTDCLVKEQEKVHLGIEVGANIMVTGVAGQEGAEGNVAEKKKVKESNKANLGKLLKYNVWSTRWCPVQEMLKKFGLEDFKPMKTPMSTEMKLTKDEEGESQTALAISTTEAEYVSAGKACQQALWMKQALVDYGISLDGITLMCDNKGAIDLSKNPVQHSRTKHIEIRHHFLRDNVQKGNISIEKVSSEDNIADILTKPLKREPFNYLRLGLGMMEQID
ncbi:hypothetical protein Tco_0746214 [Tanacetum coccineum]